MTGAGGVPPIIGCDDEIRAVSTFLARLADGPRALVLEGSAGIGKTTLWQLRRASR